MIKCNDDSANHSGMRAGWRIAAAAIALALICAFLIGTPAPAQASDTDVAQAGNGVIDVSYINNDEPIAGAHLALYRVAEQGKSGSYEPTAAFSRYADIIDWSGLHNADSETLRLVAQTLSAYAQRDGIAPDAEATTDSAGHAAFTGLAEGLYLVTIARYQGTTDAGYDLVCDATALLVALPAPGDDAGTANGTVGTTMHVTLTPKTECTTKPHEPEHPDEPDNPGSETTTLTARKVWKGDGSTPLGAAARPKSVTVQLLRDGKVAGTAVLNESNQWTHRWTGLEAGHDWQVVERTVPEQYTVTLDREGNEIVITNTHVTPPNTGSSITSLVMVTVVIAVAAIGLAVCVTVGRRMRDD